MSMNVPVLPDFTRWQWAGVAEKKWFTPLVSRASNAFIELERLSVVEGLRPAAWQFINYTDLVPLTVWAQRHGVRVIPLQHAFQSGNYSSSGSTGTPNCFRVVIVRPENFDAVFPFDNNERIGSLLGYPDCCRRAFAATWDAGQVDSTYEQLSATIPNDPNNRYASTLLRWVGMRFVPHMPCSYSCEASQSLGKGFADIGRSHGFREEVAFMEEALSWPVYWNRLFGIAELITPVLRLTMRTDWTPRKQEHSINMGMPLKSFVRPTDAFWKQNGYSEPEAMRRNHDLLLSQLDSVDVGARVLDLGCGNGLLMKRLRTRRPDITVGGIDINADAIKAAGTGFDTMSIESGGWATPDVAVFMPGRLLEMIEEDATATVARLRTIPTVFVYTYSDWTEPLDALTARLGLGPIEMLVNAPGISIGVRRGPVSRT